MTRAGREPAEDVKRRLKVACEAEGLTVLSAKLHLMKDLGARLILVDAAPRGWAHEAPLIEILTSVPVSGDFPETVDIRCMATEGDPVMSVFSAPVMRGRHAVPIEGLEDALAKTLDEREQVLAAIKLGISGPYRFDDISWEIPTLGF